jgi:ABC-2 type transport system ATP-binding protein
VLLNGSPLSTRQQDLKRQIGFATQDLALYPELTAQENLRFFGQLYQIPAPKLAERIDQLLRSTGLTDRANDRASTFSGGMKRRLNLAIALIHDPQLLLLDEPTTGVDPQSRNHIFDLIRKVNSQGLTIVYTSHYMEEVQALCPRIAIMDQGNVQACDSLPGLLARLPSLAKLSLPGSLTQEQCTEVVSALASLPGILSSEIADGTLIVTGHDLSGVLAQICLICDRLGLRPTRVETTVSTLEQVFLTLTGRALRD